jgi:protein tyrosine phosphatase (PTP) superfamily phosphohydrolase (DUF442 family)
MSNRRASLFPVLLVVVLSIVAGCSGQQAAPESSAPAQAPSSTVASPTEAPPGVRPATWAEPLDVTGAANLYKVSDDLYRSAQPTAEGMTNLKALGVKTIVNLRSLHSDLGLLVETGLKYEHIPMLAWDAEEDDVVGFLRIVVDPERTPVLVHCEHGSDRTGIACAMYRIVVQGWSKEEAVREMTEGGFGFHETSRGLLRYIRAVDVEAIQRKVKAD